MNGKTDWEKWILRGIVAVGSWCIAAYIGLDAGMEMRVRSTK